MAFKISKNTKIKKIRDIYSGEFRVQGKDFVKLFSIVGGKKSDLSEEMDCF